MFPLGFITSSLRPCCRALQPQRAKLDLQIRVDQDQMILRYTPPTFVLAERFGAHDNGPTGLACGARHATDTLAAFVAFALMDVEAVGASAGVADEARCYGVTTVGNTEVQ